MQSGVLMDCAKSESRPKVDHCALCDSQGRAVTRSENPGGLVVICPLVDIGLTVWPKI